MDITVTVVLIVVFALMLIMPYFSQRKSRQEYVNMLSTLKVGDIIYYTLPETLVNLKYYNFHVELYGSNSGSYKGYKLQADVDFSNPSVKGAATSYFFSPRREVSRSEETRRSFSSLAGSPTLTSFGGFTLSSLAFCFNSAMRRRGERL